MLTTVEKMEKIEYMKKGYETHTLTNLYLKGFSVDGFVYAYKDKGVTDAVCETERIKDGGKTTLKYKPSTAKRRALVKSGRCLKICCVERLEYLYNNSKYNRGEIFEMLINELFGKVWHKDKTPFFVGYDLSDGLRNYSIKFFGGRYCTESTIDMLNKNYPDCKTYEIELTYELARGGFIVYSKTCAAKDADTAIIKVKNDFFADINDDGMITIVNVREV